MQEYTVAAAAAAAAASGARASVLPIDIFRQKYEHSLVLTSPVPSAMQVAHALTKQSRCNLCSQCSFVDCVASVDDRRVHNSPAAHGLSTLATPAA